VNGLDQSVAGTALLERLLPAQLALVRRAVEVGRRGASRLYLVGGSVRDLLLGRACPDLDLVVEGDEAATFARSLAAELGAGVAEHAAFLTAVLTLPDGLVIDVATARSETYAAPAALPQVRPASLAADLRRRDFTINAIALDLLAEPPRLVDPLGGAADLATGRLRVLHARSFVDDPTRILRGLRLEQRLGLRLDEQGEGLARAAMGAGVLARLSGSRLRDELERLLAEPGPEASLERLDALGVLAAVHPGLHWDRARQERWAALAEDVPRASLLNLLLMVLSEPLTPVARAWLADRLLLAGTERRLLGGFVERLAIARQALADARFPHQVVEALAPLSEEEQLFLVAEGGSRAAWVRRARRDLVAIVLRIAGADLVAAGAAPGPAIGEALRATRRARIDGLISAEDEPGFALGWLKGGGADGSPEA
jgi:tRNA nucleotidyltransferase (CCA-adding enzyme)